MTPYAFSRGFSHGCDVAKLSDEIHWRAEMKRSTGSGKFKFVSVKNDRRIISNRATPLAPG